MILFGVDMFERRVELYDGAIDGVVPESTPNVVHGSLQLLEFLSFCFVFEKFELFGRRCRNQVAAADAYAAQRILPTIAYT